MTSPSPDDPARPPDPRYGAYPPYSQPPSGQYPYGPNAGQGSYQAPYPQPGSYGQQPYGQHPGYPPPQPKKPKSWPWIAGGIVIALFVFVSCVASISNSGTTSNPSSGSNRPGATSAAPASVEPAPTNPAFGEAFTYENGLQVTVGPPEAFTPSPNQFTPRESPA